MAGIVLACAWFAAQPVRADPNRSALEITVEDRRALCVTEQALRARVAYYASSAKELRGLRVRVGSVNGVTEFLVFRGDRMLARRRFESLPSACDDRRDTLALAIALAVESTAGMALLDEPVAPDPTASSSESNALDAANPSAEIDAASSAEDRAVEPEETAASPARPTTPPMVRDSAPAPSARTLEPETTPETTSEVETDQAQSDPPAAAALLYAGARYVWRVLPVSAFAFSAGVELPIGKHGSMLASGLLSMAARSDFGAGRLRTQLAAGEVLGCGRFGIGALGVQGCGGATAGAMAASGEGYDDNGHVTLAWVAALARVSLGWPADSPVAARVFWAGHANLVRPRLQIAGGLDAEFVTPVVGMALGLELIVAWP